MRTIISAAIATLAIAAGPIQAQDSDMAFGTEEDIAQTVPSRTITLTLGDLHFSWQDRF